MDRKPDHGKRKEAYKAVKASCVNSIASGLILSLLVTLAALPLTAVAEVNPVTEQRYSLNLPQQTVAESLNDLAKQSGAQFLFPYKLAQSKAANPVKGHFTLLQATQTLLQNTGLKSDLVDGVLTISQANNGYAENGSSPANQNGKGKRNMKNTMNTKKNVLATFVALFAAGGVSQGVLAQDENEAANAQVGIDEIIVTAQKREQRLLDVPISISVVGSETLKNAGIDSIADLSYLVPNLSVEGYSSSGQRYLIRGVGNLGGNDNASLVGIYLDDIPLSTGTASSIDVQTIDIAQVEVLKGPQGTFYGNGSVGGTIRYVSNAPSFDGVEGSLALSASDTAGGDTSSKITAIANLPVIDDVLAFRIAATYNDRGGWIDKINSPGGEEDHNSSELSHIRLRGLWQVSDDFTADISLIQHRNDEGGNSGSNVGDGNFLVVERNGLLLAETGRSNDYDLYNLTLNYDLGWAELVSSSSKVETEVINKSDSSIDIGVIAPAFSGFDLFASSSFSEKSMFSQELRLVGNGKQLHWVVGAFYLDVDRRDQVDAGAGIYLNGAVYKPPGFESFPDAFFLGPALDVISGSESYAVFGDIAYDFTEQLTVTLGTRYFEDEQFRSNLVDKPAFDKVSSKVSLSYALADNASVYASASQGFRSGGQGSGITPAYGPEEVNAFELGYKASLLDGRLNAEAALYFSQYDDYIMSATDISVSPFAFSANGGEAEIQGFEFATQFQATESLSLGLSGNVTETEFVTVTFPTVHVGDPITASPKYSYTAHADYSFDWSADTAGFAYLSYSRQGPSSGINRETWGELENSDLGFVSANLGAQWQDFTLTLSGKNLTNEQRSTIALSLSRLGVEARRPRTLSLSASYQF